VLLPSFVITGVLHLTFDEEGAILRLRGKKNLSAACGWMSDDASLVLQCIM